jgi:RNA polymerase sigma factor (sigma-70 family)
VLDTAAVARLLVEARGGDAAAFAELYVENVGWVRHYARRLAGREYAAEDLVAEAFTRTWAQLSAGRGPQEAFVPYLRAVVLNLHLTALKRDRRLKWVADVEGAAMADPDLASRIAEHSPEEIVLEQLFNARIKEAMSTLPVRWQIVLVRVYIENQPYRDLAVELELSANATRQLAQRARRGMRKALHDLAAADLAAAEVVAAVPA